MNEIYYQIIRIGNALFELWHLLPEPKKSYTTWYSPIGEAIDSWHLSDREKRVANREKGNVGI